MAPLGGFPFLSAVLLVGGGATAILALIGFRRRETPGARAFSLLAGSMALYTILYAFSLPFAYGPIRITLGTMQWFGIALIPVTWLLFALEYSGRPEYLTRRFVVALSIIPALAVGGAVAQAMPVAETSLVGTYGNLFYASTTSTEWMGHTFVSHETGLLYQLYIGYAYLCFLGGVGMLLEFVARFDRLYQDQALSIIVGGLFPWVGNVLAVTGREPIPGIDLLPFTIPVTALLFANAVFRHELLDFTPATRRKGESTLVEEMRDAVVVVDDADRIVNVNTAACGAFGVSKEDALGAELSKALDVVIPLGSERFEVTHDATVYEVTVSPVFDRFDSVIGRTLAFRDITDHRDDEQRLSVLNRVLRHNLRTEVNVISGYASMAADELPEDRTDIATEISVAAQTLDELGQQAREVERIMSREADSTSTHYLSLLLEDAVSGTDTGSDGVEVSIPAPSNVRVAIDGVVFEAVVRDLVNALAQYGPRDATHQVSTSISDRDVTLRVQVDGDGIPASEYEVVLQGEETPLDHASGLSLWLVKWGVRRLDGDLRFDEDGDIVLTIPDCVVGFDGPPPDDFPAPAQTSNHEPGPPETAHDLRTDWHLADGGDGEEP